MRPVPTKDEIIAALTRVDDPSAPRPQRLGMHAIGRALCHIQRRDERCDAVFKVRSHGFDGADNARGASMAAFYQEYGFLTTQQVRWWLQPDRRGRPRICKYWQQIQEEVKWLNEQEEERRSRFLPPQIDLFDSDEVVMDRMEKLEDERQRRLDHTQAQRSRYFQKRALRNNVR